jgi:hypothetical protein
VTNAPVSLVVAEEEGARQRALAAASTTLFNGAALACPVRGYRAIPEWIAGYGALFLHTGASR